MESNELSKSFLELSSNPVRFEAVNQLTNVFFDDSNKHVFAVRSGGVMGVVVKSCNDDKVLNFRMEDHGPVLSIKFSLDHKILAVQRTTTSVEFMNFNGISLDAEYSQSCKKNSNILGFVWSQNNEVAFMTDHGIELYMIITEKKTLKHLKSISVTLQWFVWCSVNKIALLASAHGSHLQPVVFKNGTINKLPKVETEPGRMALERDVTLSTLYNVPAVLILRHQSGPQSAEVHVHTLSGPGQTPVKTHVLKLGLSGRFAINVVDDLILVHHQASRSSQIFDIGLPGESDGNVQYHTTIVPAKSIKPVQISIQGLVEPQTHLCELYSPNWVVFQPNIVIDAKLGCLWHIHLCLSEILKSFTSLGLCTHVALKRTNAKKMLLELILEAIKRPKPLLSDLQESFNHINKVYRNWVEDEIQSQTASPPGVPILNKTSPPPRVLINQDDFYNEIFRKIDFDTELQKLEWTLISYITSLYDQGILAQKNLNEILISVLVKQKKFSTLQQMLQYGVLTDSKPLACLLLSLTNLHPAAAQAALDMMARLDGFEEIQEILLSEGQILSAMKVAGNNSKINPRKFLQYAQDAGNDVLFHSVLYFLKNNPQFTEVFTKDERLKVFLEDYDARFLNN